MSGISSSVGIFSGINTDQLISQLLQIDAQPKVSMQRRIVSLQGQQAAYLDLNSRLAALKTAAQAFRLNRVFDAAHAVSSAPDSLNATASAGAALGSYSFVVDRLVTTKQMISRGFASNATPVGATSFTFETDQGRLDRDTELAQLNGGTGIQRGRIIVTDSAGASATIDLSRVASVNEVLDAINGAENIGITASVSGDHFVLTDTAGGTAGVRVQSAPGDTTAESLGLAHNPTPGETSVTGTAVYRLAGTTSLTALNDGNGVRINNRAGTAANDFVLSVTGNPPVNVNLGSVYDAQLHLVEGPVTTMQGVIDRINAAADGKATASVTSDGTGIQITSATGTFSITDVSGAAADLGITGSSQDAGGTQTLTGTRVLAAMNSTLVRNLTGGTGLSSGAVTITTHAGTTYSLTLGTTGSVSDMINQVSQATSGNVTLALDETGTGLMLTDHTTGAGGSTLIVSGAGAVAMGLDTAPAGTTEQSVSGDRMQHRYIAESTQVSSFNGGRGVGTGRFEIRDSTGRTEIVDIGSDTRNLADVIQEINSRPLDVRARINDNGDGIIIEEDDPAHHGSQTIRVRDVVGNVAQSLGIVGEAENATDHNFIDGSFEHTVTFEADDTLADMATKVNQAGVGVRASIINDGTSVAPFRLSFTSANTGREGRFTLASAGVDLGLSTLAEGRDARAFFGAADPADAVLLTSTTNTLSGVIQGVTIDLQGVSTDPVTVDVSGDTDAIRSAVNDFVSAYNDVISKVDSYSTYNADTQQRGTLLGDTLTQQLRSTLFNTVEGSPQGVDGQYQFLAQVGVKLNANGELEVDQARLDHALETDPDAVKALFAARVQNPRDRVEVVPGITVNNTGRDTFTSLGVGEMMGQLADTYLDPIDGLLAQRKKTLDTQIDQQNKRISDLDDRLVHKRAFLQQQFLSMEQALGQLQSQQQALGSLGG